MTFSLANRGHLAVVLGILLAQGDVCAACGWGTRKTSKNWNRCKNPECGQRVERRELPEFPLTATGDT